MEKNVYRPYKTWGLSDEISNDLGARNAKTDGNQRKRRQSMED